MRKLESGMRVVTSDGHRGVVAGVANGGLLGEVVALSGARFTAFASECEVAGGSGVGPGGADGDAALDRLLEAAMGFGKAQGLVGDMRWKARAPAVGEMLP